MYQLVEERDGKFVAKKEILAVSRLKTIDRIEDQKRWILESIRKVVGNISKDDVEFFENDIYIGGATTKGEELWGE